MTLTSWLWEIVSWLSLPIMAVLAGILVWRKLHRVFPLFFGFLVVSELAGLLRFGVAQLGSLRTYTYVYWFSDLVLMVFNVLAVYELVLKRLFPRFYKVSAYRHLFAAGTAVIIVAAWATGFVSHSESWFGTEARVLSFIVVAALAFFVSLMIVMGRAWTRYDFGLAFGFAINNAAVLITSAVWVRTHYQASIIDQLPVTAFDLSCLLWLYCFCARDTSPAPLGPARTDPEALHQARGWESMLKTWLVPGRNKR